MASRLPGSSSGISDPKVSAFGQAMGNHIKAHDANTFWQKGNVSVGRDGAGYNFDNGGRATVGSNGLGYRFNNGAEVHGKPTAGGFQMNFNHKF